MTGFQPLSDYFDAFVSTDGLHCDVGIRTAAGKTHPYAGIFLMREEMVSDLLAVLEDCRLEMRQRKKLRSGHAGL